MSAAKITRINTEIKAPQVLLIDQDGNKIGIMDIQKALSHAADAALDLVEIAPNAEPPVCRILDYGKYRFAKSKKKTAQRKKTKRVSLKEVKFRPTTDTADYNVKVRNAVRFLQHGSMVKITLRFRGRELAHHELGLSLLKRVEKDLEIYGTVEQQPKFEGRQVIMLLIPKKDVNVSKGHL